MRPGGAGQRPPVQRGGVLLPSTSSVLTIIDGLRQGLQPEAIARQSSLDLDVVRRLASSPMVQAFADRAVVP